MWRPGIIIWIFLSWIKESESCGIMTHISVGLRATDQFELESEGVNYRQLLEKHQDAFQAGCIFPDTFYNSLCRNEIHRPQSEDAHWTPFANATVNYIRRKYPKPWSQETEKLVVLLFGIIAHSVSDASWHSLGIAQGFLRTMGNINFHGNYDEAHSTGDFGGDVINVVELNTSSVGFSDKWYIPTADIVEIYKELHGEVRITADVVDECAVWMFLGRAGEQLGVIDMLYPSLSDGTPFLTNRIQDYFLGGMNDMATWTTNGWRNTVHMIDNGPSSCKLARNPLFVQCGTSDAWDAPESILNGDIEKHYEGTNREDYISNIVKNMDASFVKTEKTDRGVYIRPSKKLKEMYRNKIDKLIDMRESVPRKEERTVVENLAPNAFYDTAKSYARVGRSVATGDMNNDGHMDLIIGAPGHLQGRVYIVYGSADGLPRKNLTLENDADIILDGFERDGLFGHAITVADVNADGVKDLVVSAPSVGSPQLTYTGELYVFYVQKTGALSRKPDLIFKCRQKYCNLGWSLTSGDVNGDGKDDVVIGAPYASAGGEQNGFVAVLFSKKNHTQRLQYEDGFDWMAKGDQKYGWFGYDVAASEAHLVVGSPTRRNCVRPDCSYDKRDVQAVGRVSVYKTPLTSSSVAWRTFEGTSENDYMGANVHIGNFAGKDNVFSIALPSRKAGVMRFYQATKPDTITKFVEYRGSKAYGRFGSSTLFEDMNGDGINDALVGSPHWTENTQFYSGGLQGRVQVFDGKKATGISQDPELELVYGEQKSKFGSSMTSVRNTRMTDLAVSAPGSNAKAKLGGRVALFTLFK